MKKELITANFRFSILLVNCFSLIVRSETSNVKISRLTFRVSHSRNDTSMKIIIAPDKFKGSLSTFEVCHAIRDGIHQADDSAELLLFPMADGGDGFAAVMKFYLHTNTVECETVDPLGKNITASYQWNSETKTAIIEMAVASGLVLLKDEERNPLKTS